MMYAQYCRIESAAGGVACTEREFIRACHGVLSPSGKSHERREWRHEWINEGLDYRIKARVEYAQVMGARKA